MASTVPSARPVAGGVVLAVLLVVVTALWPGDDEHRSRVTPSADRTGPLAVLRAWDRHRAQAWRDGDLAALGDLYVPGARAGRTDRAMLAAYLDRGLRVTRMGMQVAAADVVRADDDRVVLVVTDRLAAATTVGAGVRRPLPRDRWSTRRLVLVRAGERWRMVSVATQRSAVSSTAAASGSSNR